MWYNLREKKKVNRKTSTAGARKVEGGRKIHGMT